MDGVTYSENPPLSDETLNLLFERSWPGHAPRPFQPVLQRSLVYFSAHDGDRLIGFVHLATDGGAHAFLLDTTVLPEYRHRGIGTALVRRAIEAATSRGVAWIHVDYVAELEGFYGAAGFRPTRAGLIDVNAAANGRTATTSPPSSSPFDQLRATGLIVQTLLGGAGALVFALLYPPLRDQWKDPFVAMALFYLGAGVVLYLRARSAHLDADKLFGPPPSRDTLRLAVVAIPLATLSIAGFWLLFLPISYGAPEFVRQWIERASDRPALTFPSWSVQFLVAVVVAPVLEEVFFRGILFQRWARRWGTRNAVLASSALFAICHFELLGHFLFAVVMCALYLRTRSLWAPIVTHALNNFLATIGGLSGALHPDRAEKQMTLASFQSDWWVGLVTLAAGLALLEGYRRLFWRDVSLRALLTGPTPYER
jgi:membrane protease YdiL (CAAX protease family)/GNAT superfamily N-acetyltransferase